MVYTGGSSSCQLSGRHSYRVESGGRFSEELRAVLGRPPTRPELDAFSKYLSLLLRWNRVHPLTGYHEREQIREKLFLDSLLFLQFVPRPDCRVLDLGSGAGIPGIPMKIVCPTLRMVLVEARRRRVSFLNALVRELMLDGIRVIGARAEVVLEEIPELAESFDIVVARAFGPPAQAAQTALRFLKIGGTFVASGPPLQKRWQTPLSGTCRITVSPKSRAPRRFFVLTKSS